VKIAFFIHRVDSRLMTMGVNHGGRGDESPQNLQWGDANTGCPPRFLSFFKISSARHGFVPPQDFNPDLRHCWWLIFSSMFWRKTGSCLFSNSWLTLFGQLKKENTYKVHASCRHIIANLITAERKVTFLKRGSHQRYGSSICARFDTIRAVSKCSKK
jgi:hypothetical protein